jgi:hypothetical protein
MRALLSPPVLKRYYYQTNSGQRYDCSPGISPM